MRGRKTGGGGGGGEKAIVEIHQHHFIAIPSDSKTSTLCMLTYADKGYYNQMITSEDKNRH